jgi:hypothetical protein
MLFVDIKSNIVFAKKNGSCQVLNVIRITRYLGVTFLMSNALV